MIRCTCPKDYDAPMTTVPKYDPELSASLELRSMTSLCDNAQRDRDFFRAQAEERGRELRKALLEVEHLSAQRSVMTDELRACSQSFNEALAKALKQCKDNESTIAKLTLKIKRLESASKPSTSPRRRGKMGAKSSTKG